MARIRRYRPISPGLIIRFLAISLTLSNTRASVLGLEDAALAPNQLALKPDHPARIVLELKITNQLHLVVWN